MIFKNIFPGENHAPNKDEIAKKGGLEPLVTLLDSSDRKVQVIKQGVNIPLLQVIFCVLLHCFKFYPH